MLRVAAARARRNNLDAARLKFVHSSLPEWSGDGEVFDGIVTQFFLDCFASADLTRVVSRLAALTAAEARWLNVDFAIPAGGFPRQRARLIHGLMYGAFRATTEISAGRLTLPDALLRGHGFTRKAQQEFNLGLLHAEWWSRREDLGHHSITRQATGRDSLTTTAETAA